MQGTRYRFYAVISIVATAIGLLSTIATVPIQIHYLGVVDYAYWVLFASAGLLVTIIGAGMPQATIRFVNGLDYKSSSTFYTILKITLAQMVFLFSVVVIFHGAIFQILKIPSDYTHLITLLVLASGWTLGILLNVMYSLLFAFSQHAVAYILQSISSIIVVFLNWLVLRDGYGILGLSWVQAISTAATLIVILLLVLKHGHRDLFRPGHKRGVAALEILRYGFYQMIGQFAFGLIFNLDNILANRYVGVNEMVYYNFRLKIFQIITSVALKPFWNYIPLISAAYDRMDIKFLKGVFLKSLKLSVGVIAIAAAMYFIGIERVIGLWTGSNIPINRGLDFGFSVLLLVEQILGNIAIVVSGLDVKTNGYLTSLSVVESLCNLCLSLVLGHFWGLSGIVWGTIIPRLGLTTLLISRRIMVNLRISLPAVVTSLLHPSWVVVPLALVLWSLRDWVSTASTFWFIIVMFASSGVSIAAVLALSNNLRVLTGLIKRIGGLRF